MQNQRRNSRRRGIATATALTTMILVGCASPPTGPPFAAAPAPAPDRARLYVYRMDPRASVSPVRLQIDGQPVGTLADGEYAAIELTPGVHRLEAGVRSVTFVAWGWNDLRLHIAPGETAYLKVSVRLTERAQPAGRALDIAGRAGGAVSENVYLQPLGEAEALRDLADTTRFEPLPEALPGREP